MNFEEGLIIPLRGTEIYYLDKHHLEQCSNVTLISDCGQRIKVNHLQLAVFTTLLNGESFETSEDFVITTNLDYKDLNTVKDFVTEGLLPAPMEVLKQEIPAEINAVFQSFGIQLGQVLNGEVAATAVNKVNVKKEMDYLQVKLEEADVDYDPDHEPMLELPYDAPTMASRRKRKIKRESDYESEEDDEWRPQSHYSKGSRKFRIKEENYGYEDEWFGEDFGDRKPRKSIGRPRGSGGSGGSSVFNRNERELKLSCEKFLENYADYANLSIPDEAHPESKVFATFQFANPIENYICQPKPAVKIHADKHHPWACEFCPARLNTASSLKNHNIVFHTEHFQCNLCKHVSSLDQLQDFKLHMMRHETRKHECIHCGFTNTTLRGLEIHFKSEGSFHNNKCTQCSYVSKTHAEYKEHVQNVHFGMWLYKCGICDNVAFNTPEEVKAHRNKEHETHGKKPGKPDKPLGGLKMCDLCGKEVTSLTSHHKMHHEEDLQKCPECPKICKTKYHLDDHIKGTHSRIPCEHCGLMIPIRRKERHIQQAHVNPEDRKYKCEHCGKGFTDRQKLNDHINTHTGERPYVCKYCGKGFANHGNQRAHIRQAHLGQKRNYRK